VTTSPSRPCSITTTRHLQKPPEPYVVADSLHKITAGAHQVHQDLQNIELHALHQSLSASRQWNNFASRRPSSSHEVEHRHRLLDPLRPGVFRTNQRQHKNAYIKEHPFHPFPSTENCRSAASQWSPSPAFFSIAVHPPAKSGNLSSFPT
jgi:hypothetical protein